MIILDVIITVLLFLIFAFSHTLLAALKIKKRLTERIGNKIAFYRLFYNISSLLIFFVFYELSPKPDVIVYNLQKPYDIIIFVVQVLSLIGFFWASKPIRLIEFIGIGQIERYYKGTYNPDDLDEKLELKIVGAYKIVRHPIYLFSIMFLGLRPTMDLSYLVMFVCITIYFYIGSIYEEKKLVEVFGDEYKEYQKNVPKIIPWIYGKKNPK